MKKTWIVFFAVLVFAFSLAVSADEHVSLSYAETGLSIDAEEYFAPEGDGVRVVEIKTGMFSCGGDVLRRRIVELEYTSALSITLPTDTIGDGSSYDSHGYTEASFIITDVTEEYRALSFGISISGIAGTEYTLDLTLSSETDDYVSKVTFVPSEWNRINLDITGMGGEEFILKVRVSYTADTMPDAISLSSPCLSTDLPSGFLCSEKYLTAEFTSDTGSVKMESGNVFPDSRGDAVLFADILTNEKIYANTNAVVEIRLSGVMGGYLSLGVRTSSSNKNAYAYSPSIPLDAEDGIYAIPIYIPEGFAAYSLDFSNIECTGFFKIESVQIHSGGEVQFSAAASVGSVDHIRVTDGGIIFSGSMERSAVGAYSDGGIRYYTIPALTSADLSTAIEIGRSSTTTIFEYTMSTEELNVPISTYMFFAAVIGNDGEIIPFSSPRFAEAASADDTGVSNMGLYNASAAGVFESNVSHIMLDVDLSKLIAEEGAKNAASVSYYAADGSTKTVGIDRDLIKSLDGDIEFYVSAGINVYLRLTASSPVEGLTYMGENCLTYGVMADNADALSEYAAIVRFISERYGKISGISLGIGVNSAYNVGDADIFDIAEYAVRLALLARVTYNAASADNPDLMILVEFDEYRDDDTQVSDRVLGTAFANRLYEIGSIPWAYVYSIDNTEDELYSPVSFEKALTALGIDGADLIMYFYDPMGDNLTYKYSNFVANSDREKYPTQPSFAEYLAITFGELCEKGAEVGARAVFMSLGDILGSADHEFYSSLKNTGMGNSERHVVDLPAYADDGLCDGATGVYVLSDFSDKYYNLDWISAGGVASLLTEHSEIFSEKNGSYSRVLRSSVDTVGAAGAAGLIIRNLQGATDLMDTKLAFDFSVLCEGGAEDLTVVFVVGADDNRAEFTAEKLTPGEAHRIVCDLSEYEFASSVEYIGVMIYSEDSVVFDLSRVSVYSDTKTDAELSELFSPTETGEERGYDGYILGVLIFIIAAISTVGCIVFMRRDKEETEAGALNSKTDRRGNNGK